MSRPRQALAAGTAAALLWLALGLRWFDPGARWRPRWLEVVPPAALLAAFAAAFCAWLWLRRAEVPGAGGPQVPGLRAGLMLTSGLAILFRLPLAMQGAAGYLTADGALSGIVALRLLAGERLVFVPQVAYSGSLKSHVTAALAAMMEPARAFALASVLFYAAMVGAVFGLGWLAARGSARWTATAAALYVAFAPAFATRYSLSNDGNYVEVLALGTAALLAAVRWWRRGEGSGSTAVLTGALLGLAFWCHVLALVHILTVGVWMLVTARLRALRAAPAVLLGFVLGAWPAVLWNAGHGWETVRYLVPGGEGVDPGALSIVGRLQGIAVGQWPVLLGYDPGNPAPWDLVLRAASSIAIVVLLAAIVAALRGPRTEPVTLLLTLLAVNVALAVLALPVIQGNPRYLIFTVPAVAVLLARFLEPPRVRWAMAALVAFGAASALSQAPGALRADSQWRGFVADLERSGVRFCHTDFYLAAKVNFLSRERVVCSAKLGPTRTEYFPDYRPLAEAAPDAALIAVNATHASKLERRLQRQGITYERMESMKPVLLRFSRPVDPALLFPDQDFPVR